MRGLGRRGVATAALLFLFVTGRAEAQQDLGHRLLGTAGLDAGVQPAPGLYLAYRLLGYSAFALVDRNGNRLPLNLGLHAEANGLGIGATVEIPAIGTYYSAAVSIPYVSVAASIDHPAFHFQGSGIGDLYVEPVALGWRSPHLDVVASYALYIPTGSVDPGGLGVGHGYFTHEWSLGDTVYFDNAKVWRASAIASFDLNDRKAGTDFTRGATVQVQGGTGVRLGPLDAGVVGYGLWQVDDDSGSSIPAALRGSRDRSLGMGGEIDLAVPRWRSRFTLRYVHDLAVESRPLGQLFIFGITVAPWQPGDRAAVSPVNGGMQ